MGRQLFSILDRIVQLLSERLRHRELVRVVRGVVLNHLVRVFQLHLQVYHVCVQVCKLGGLLWNVDNAAHARLDRTEHLFDFWFGVDLSGQVLNQNDEVLWNNSVQAALAEEHVYQSELVVQEHCGDRDVHDHHDGDKVHYGTRFQVADRDFAPKSQVVRVP